MIKLYADFNSRTPEGLLTILVYNGKDIGDQIDALQIKSGDKVILYQDEDDFEVVATLELIYSKEFGSQIWTATPDWSTLVRFGKN